MSDLIHDQAITLSGDGVVREILGEVCRITGMGFAAVARVTENRWIACQVLDRIEFGLDAGDELDVSTTICDDIRKTSRTIVIDEAGAEAEWRTHPTPILYGFQSYISVPITLRDGRLFGTLCAIDPRPRPLRAPELVATIEALADRIGRLLESADARVS